MNLCTKYDCTIDNNTIFVGKTFTQKIEKIILKYPTCNVIIFCDESCYNHPNTSFPLNTLVVYFGHKFNQNVQFSKTIQSVNFGYKFNKSFIVPKSMRLIFFGSTFDQPVMLSKYMVEIKFGYNFTHEFSISKTLKKLTLDANFRNKLKLSKSLEFLDLGSSYNNKPLKLPKSIKVLVLSIAFKQNIIFPQKLRSLIFVCDYQINVPLPESLRNLCIRCKNYSWYLDVLPNSLFSLDLSMYLFNEPMINLPNQLKILRIRNKLFDSIIDKPTSLQMIEFP